MKICEEKTAVSGGDCFKHKDGDYYLVVQTRGTLRLYCIDDGNMYCIHDLFGGDEGDFIKVNGCFKIES
jgi:hypothetical protein